MGKTKRSTNWSRNNIPLKTYDNFKLKMKQLICLHGDYVYLELTTQNKRDNGNVMVFARGCKKCGWINCSHPYAGMPRTQRNSYDKTYLKITDKHDNLLSDKVKVSQTS